MIEQLFGSKTRVKLLQLFYANPSRSFYVREITRKIDEQINSVRRELSNLLTIGIISSDNSNNRLYYQVNKKFEYYKPLHDIFSGIKPGTGKTKSPEETDGQMAAIRQLGNVELAALMGEFTRDATSGIDVLIVGDVNQTKLQKFIAALEQEESRELRYALFSHDEFMYRVQIKDRFISNVQLAKKEVIIDKYHLLTEPEPSISEE